jgi:nitrite reductase/ring-hydroxylating ferredoxin subunit
MMEIAANIVPQRYTYLRRAALCTHDHLLMNLRTLILPAVLAMLLGTGCKKEQTTQVPPVTVDIQININLPAYNALAVTGGWVYITGGSQGIIVYRNSPDAFTALDRHCTFQPEDYCRVTVDDSEVMARDTTCCHSAFLLMDGSVVNGPAALGLKQYHTTFNGTTLRIFN